jgi:hypothetical protein
MADNQLEARLDLNDYDESELVEIKVELNIPYQYTWSNFERHSGEIELNGKIYTYVKRKIQDGYLILKCIPNIVKQNLRNADNILFAQNNGLDQERNGKNDCPFNNIFKYHVPDYDDDFTSYDLNASQNSKKDLSYTKAVFFETVSLPVSEQPPEDSLYQLS